MNASTRRQFLKGVSLGAGSFVLAPVWNQILAQASGTAHRARRFVFVVEGNGLNPPQIQPVGLPRKKEAERTELVQKPLAPHALPKALEPLEPWKDRVTILQGLSGRVCGGGHSNDFGALGCYPAKGGVGTSGSARGETIDAALAKKLGGVFPLVGLGISDRREHTLIYNCSAWDQGRPLPTQCRPDLAYAQLFGSCAEGSAQQEFLSTGNMLDFLLDDLRRLERRVAGAERDKLQAHVGAYEDLRRRHSRLNEIKSTLRRHAPVVTDKFRSDVETDRLDAHFDLAAAALIGGLTPVVTIASGAGNPYFSIRFTGLGINLDKHSIGHGGSYEGKTWEELTVTIRRFHFELIARLIKKLQAVPEGNGTMLDQTLIVYLSDAAEGHHSRCWEWPFVLIGHLGGTLKAGRYVEYPYWGKKGHKTIGNLYTTFLHAVGDRRPHFGVQDPTLDGLDLNGPLPELLA
ncbi:MAG TPA: DUF1552 domain-containing protein [Planctomycetota bacterium]|nr:DUF1552 domain-containing protein [Planctomycetota bacterium]